ncbi:MAG: hypothetical protein PHV56_05710 [Clostridia bacterium]|nr:hypothetical protein [Clostridia bacterium]
MIVELNGEFDEAAQKYFNTLLITAPVMRGTYYPPVDSMLAAYSVLENTFFDDGSKIAIKAEGDIGTIPYEDGVVY